jgi:N utilization substance protein B
MAARSKARRRALDILFESELRNAASATVLAERQARAESGLPDYTVALVEGVGEHRAKLDALLAAHSRGWALDRMPAVDRNVLRIGAYELLWRDDVPPGVAIAEAVALASQLSTAESPAFVNGLLARLHELRATLDLGSVDPVSR